MDAETETVRGAPRMSEVSAGMPQYALLVTLFTAARITTGVLCTLVL